MRPFQKYAPGADATPADEGTTEEVSRGTEEDPNVGPDDDLGPDKVAGGGVPTYEQKFEQKWNKNYEMLVEYKTRSGNCLVSTKSGTGLGGWVRRQRKTMKNLGRKGFDPDRLAKLESIGFDFNPGSGHRKSADGLCKGMNAEKWDEKYE